VDYTALVQSAIRSGKERRIRSIVAGAADATEPECQGSLAFPYSKRLVFDKEYHK
jgi:hypothetical protein